MKMTFFTVMLLAAFGIAVAGETAVKTISIPAVRTDLKAGEGKDKTTGLCSICHSLDYITMQPPFSRSQWTATVNKMIKLMGAPISEEDAKIIVNYLVANYGTGN